ncbi:hypothetical protein LOTGIDRAFT_230621 [Lottia gigantea]|uniref:Serine/threonine-protein kinase ULK3 n=1 Tax=Lottia gigantea TaxID=225164 RepID=V4B5G9_LOTGI|nr:hypothetical protein LOTGIDRAFT_230621 [Lottia gigantea]ESP01247.1 hypothetical protein LOTGIDRAFT_230621 [Lottia gigantea]
MASRPSSAKNTVIPQLKDYVFTEKLGSGTYATVYKAYRKTGVREVVAIKCVLKSSLNRTSTENLLTEIELLKKLKHENIVELKDFRWDDVYIYLIMEYCSGGDLSHFIRKKRALPEQIVKRFLQQIAQAMKFLWDNNVAHMDLKPQNILLTSVTHPRLKIADFGFAKHLYDGDELRTMRGSPLYMAPEIICSGNYDARVDLWSIGVILYECLFGKAPFASKSFKELGAKIWDERSVELPYGVDISENARDIVLRLLQRKPEDRITFEEFFAHPFIDLEHTPNSQSLQNATNLVTEACTCDKNGEYDKAVRLYFDALQYFVAAIHYEEDSNRKTILRRKVKEYMGRAEVLKDMIKPGHSSESNNSMVPTGCDSSLTNTHIDLVELCKGHKELEAAIKLIKAAQHEVEKEDFDKALKHYEMSLGVLIKILPEEPPGKRKDILNKEVPKWLSEAEEIKSYLSVKQLHTNDTSQVEEDTSLSYFSKDQCEIQ